MEDNQIIKFNNDYKNIDYNPKDLTLLNPIEIIKEFGNKDDIIEFHIINEGNIIEIDYNFKNYTTQNSLNNSELFNTLILNPSEDLIKYGYYEGNYTINYNFYRNLFNSSFNNKYYIKDISFDRLELKISSLNSTYQEIYDKYIEYTINRNNREFYSDFILNFGDNKKLIAVNILLDNNIENADFFIKLYQPLPNDIDIKDTFWINEIIADPISYNIENNYNQITTNNNDNKIKGPNFNIELNNSVNTLTSYLNISNILSTTSSLNNQLEILKDIDININYNNIDEFIHFSSAEERLSNFIYKLRKLENLNNDLYIINNITGSNNLGVSIINIENEKNNIISNFDKFENFLYFESGSNCFPKINSTKPYINKPVSSIEVLEWLGSIDESNQYYGGKYLEFSNYDINNKDYLWNNLPEYIRLDEQNDQLKLFISMLGQHFDYLWTYIKDITNRYNNDNKLNKGISKDIIAETLKSFGIKLYTNSRNNNNIYLSLLGINPDNTFIPSTGSLLINNYILASDYTIPDDDINKEIYKRIYNNLPYLLKSKGTKNGLKALINCFGIPSTILNIKEFGANIKEENYIENKIEKFNYASLSNQLNIPFNYSYKQFLNTGYNDISPDSFEFRFKLLSNEPTQSLLLGNNREIRIINNNIDFGIEGDQGWVYSNPISLPLYNNDWWNINISRETGSLRNSQSNLNNKYILTIGNKNEFGIEYLESSSIFINGMTSSSYNLNWNTGALNLNSKIMLLQEFRFWIGAIPIDNFKDHILNPRSISYLNETSSYNNLIFRLPLGSELDNIITENISSSHPSNIPAFISNSIITNYGSFDNEGDILYYPNYELYYINNPNLGFNTENNQKIKIINNYILPDNTLSKFNKISKIDTTQQNNSNNLEISISPQNIINNDIIEQLGNFNIDNYIGDIEDKYKTKYKDLEKLKLFYYQKYLNKYNLKDIIKLLSYFDNSLFKMIKDFIPASSNLSSGLVFKSPILERNKIQYFEPDIIDETKNTNIKTSYISGNNSLDSLLTTYNSNSISFINGDINYYINDNRELYNGEFKNNNIIFENKLLYDDNKSINPNVPKIILDPIINNIENYPKSSKYLKGDSNIDYIFSSLYYNNNIEFIKSDIQEYNYHILRSLLPKYIGSKTISQKYNIYNEGDISYGKTSNIDYNNIYFGYFEEITSQSLTVPKRSNIYLKYLINEDGDVIELSNNDNLNLVQNIFNNNEKINIILDNNLNPTNQKYIDGINTIYAGGYKLEPILQNLTTPITQNNTIDFIYENNIQIINEDSNFITSSLPNNSLIIGNPLINEINNSGQINQPFTNINHFRSFNISFPVQRNTPYPSEIRQKIEGFIDIKIPIRRFTNFITRFYSNNNGTGNQWSLSGFHNYNWLSDLPFGDPMRGSVNRIRSLNVPVGVKVTLIDAGPEIGVIYTTPGFKNTTPNQFNWPLVHGERGVDRVIIEPIGDISCFSTIIGFINDFGNLPENLNPYIPIINDTSEIILRYPIKGDLILPEGQMNGNLFLKKEGTNINGIINFTLNINQPLNVPIFSPNISNSIQPNLNILNNPYYFTSPPEFIYITGSIDYGFNSGSSPVDNYYFERKNSLDSGSFFNILEGSYWLSNILYNLNNNIKQISPDITENGYEPIDNYFNIKKGDIFKFYNEDKKEFSIDFENELINYYTPQIKPELNNNERLKFIFKNEIPNLACIDYFESGSESKKIQNFIYLSKKENINNIIINKEKKQGKTSSGIVIPENIHNKIKNKIGNIIKQLKNQNILN